MKGLTNKRVMVTGATQGIGRAVAERFLEEGARVLLTDSVPESVILATVAKLATQHKDRVFGSRLDVRDDAAVVKTIAGVRQTLEGLDVLVNNAGINYHSPSHAFPTQNFDDILAINLRGAFLCSREALKIFLAQGSGLIINTSSNHEIAPKPEFVAYSVSKGGLGNLTRTLALEYADRGIRVNAVAPGATITPINVAWTEDPVKRSNVESHIPLGRVATATEVAGVFAFLASDEASYMTGQTLYVDGGLTLHTDYRTNWSS